MTPPKAVYRFEPRIFKDGTQETWEEYISRICVYFKLSTYERVMITQEFNEYVKGGVDQYCAGYVVLRDNGLYEKMMTEVKNLRPHRAPQT